MTIAIDAVPGLLPSGHNLEFEQSQTLAVTWALREILRSLDTTELRQDETTGDWVRMPARIVPQTTLAQPAQVGDTSVTVSADHWGVAAFQRGGPLQLWDLTDEELLIISEDWDEQSTEIPLSFKGLEYDGLRFAHDAGAPLGAGLFTETPESLDHMLDYTQPCLFMTVQRARRYAYGTSQIQPTYMVRLEYRLAETQPRSVGLDNVLMHPNQWGNRIQRRCERVMDAIADALEHSWTLRTALGEVAISQQDPRNPGGEVWDQTFSSVLIKQNTLQFASAGTLPVAAQLKFIDVQ